MLSIDVDQTLRSLSGSAPLDPGRVRSTIRPGEPAQKLPAAGSPYLTFELPFTGVATRGAHRHPGNRSSASARRRRPASSPARMGPGSSQSAEQRPGTYPMTLEFHGRDIDSGLELSIGANGELTFRRVEK